MAKVTREIASRSAKRQNTAAGVKMIEWFLFDRIDAEPCTTPIGRQNEAVALSLAYKTKCPLTVTELAVAWAEITLNFVVGNGVPVARFAHYG